jgi:predicted CoA-binding protein
VNPEDVLASARVIAVVGASDDPTKAAHRVPSALRERGWTVLPVNPNDPEVLGVPSVPTVLDLPDGVDVVEVFRPAEEAPGIVRQVAARGIPAVWLQLGISSPEAARLAEAHGVTYVENLCMAVVASRHDLSANGSSPAGGQRPTR